MIEFPKRVLIIAEGQEEKAYLDKILAFSNINKQRYSFSKVINAKGINNIFSRFQFEMQKGAHDIVLVFCDADKRSANFRKMVDQIGENFFINKNDGIKVVIFGNPVTLQIVLQHFGEANLKHISKAANSKCVEALTGIKGYDAREEQISAMMSKIHYRDINDFKKRLAKMSSNINSVPSTNFLLFLNRFESDDAGWIEEIYDLRK